jgi:hypothetical protein
VSESQHEADRVSESQHEANRVSEFQHEAGRVSESQHEADRVSESQHEADRVSESQHEANRVSESQHEADRVSESQHEADRVSESGGPGENMGRFVIDEQTDRQTDIFNDGWKDSVTVSGMERGTKDRCRCRGRSRTGAGAEVGQVCACRRVSVKYLYPCVFTNVTTQICVRSQHKYVHTYVCVYMKYMSQAVYSKRKETWKHLLTNLQMHIIA